MILGHIVEDLTQKGARSSDVEITAVASGSRSGDIPRAQLAGIRTASVRV